MTPAFEQAAAVPVPAITEGAAPRTRAAWLVPALTAVLAAAVVWWASVPYIVGVFHDDGVYALLAKAIATGQGFRYLQLPGTPDAAHFPPLYPLALAAVWRLSPSFPENITALLALNAACIGLAALALHRLLRGWFGWRDESAALVALTALLGVPVLSLTGALLSEPLYLAGLVPALLLAQRAVSTNAASARSAVIAGVAIGLLMLVRTHAVALLGATVLLLALRREWRRPLLAGVAAIAVQLPWLLWSRAATPVAAPLNGAYGAYPEFFKEGWRAGGVSLFTTTARANLHELWLLLGDRVWGGLGRSAALSIALLLLALMAIGAWRAARRAPVLPLFLSLHVAVLLLMSCAPPRYAWVVWPFFIVLAVLGAETLVARAPRRAIRHATLALVALPFLAMARTEARAYASREWEAPTRNASRAIAPLMEWIRHHTPANAVVLVEGEEIATLFTGRQAAPPVAFRAMECAAPASVAESRASLNEMLGAVPAGYLVTLTPTLVAAARTMPNLRQVDSLPGAGMFVVQR